MNRLSIFLVALFVLICVVYSYEIEQVEANQVEVGTTVNS